MATYNKFEQTVEYLCDGVYDFGADTFKVQLIPTTEPDAAADLVEADLPPDLSTANGYTSGGNTAGTATSSTQTSGTYTFDLADTVFTAASGSIGPFRYIVLIDDTPSSPLDPLICYFDYGSNLTLLDTETLTVNWNASGVFTLI